MNSLFMFPGQGSQALRMGFEIYNKYNAAKEVFQEVDDVLGYSLSAIIFGDDPQKLTLTQYTQPALMAVSIAILRVIEKESGKKIEQMCEFVAGHSLGEYSALCASGVLSLKDAAILLQVRGDAMADACKKKYGGMVALLGVEVDKAEELCKKAGGMLNIANDNSVGQIVISGDLDSIEKAIAIAPEIGIKKAVKLAVSGAFHSPLMSSAQEKVEDKISTINFNQPKIKLISNVTADITGNVNDIKKMLVKQITSQVRWRETMVNAWNYGVTKMVEIGSGKVLSGLAKRTVSDVEITSVEKEEEILSFIASLS